MPAKRLPASDPTTPAPAMVVRRISNPRPRKGPAKESAESVEPGEASPLPAPSPAETTGGDPAPPVTATPSAPTPPAAPAAPSAPAPGDFDDDSLPIDDDDDSPAIGGDWPEPETAGTNSPEGGKRKRRRRKGKGGQGGGQGGQPGAPYPPQGGPTGPQAADAQPSGPPEPANPQARHAQGRPGPPPQSAPQPPRPPQRTRIEPAILARRAWKIFLAEVSEEGVALINDQDARELTRRSFRLAEIFLEEQSRRLPGAD